MVGAGAAAAPAVAVPQPRSSAAASKEEPAKAPGGPAAGGLSVSPGDMDPRERALLQAAIEASLRDMQACTVPLLWQVQGVALEEVFVHVKASSGW